MDSSASSPFCIATVVTDKAIAAMLEVSGEGSYLDSHPWLIARDMLDAATAPLPILFASLSESSELEFSHWSTINSIDVVELHRGQWETRCRFGQLRPVNPIFTPIDAVFLKPSQEQVEREEREGIHVSRASLDEHHIHPYAICETPVFIYEALSPGTPDGTPQID